MDADALDQCRADPVTFARIVLGVTLHLYQEEPYRHRSRVTVVKGGAGRSGRASDLVP